MGPPQGPTFVSAVPTLNKTKNKKLEKRQVLLRTVRAIKQGGGGTITSHMCVIYNSWIPEESLAPNSNMYVCV